MFLLDGSLELLIEKAHFVGQWAKFVDFYRNVDANFLPSDVVLVLIQESENIVVT